MEKNVGKTDKIVRTIAGLAILLLGLYFRSWWGLIGFIPIIFATLGHCPLYKPLGINTCKHDHEGCCGGSKPDCCE